jgi:formylmethanofuran dehydrogenase subunit E
MWRYCCYGDCREGTWDKCENCKIPICQRHQKSADGKIMCIDCFNIWYKHKLEKGKK